VVEPSAEPATDLEPIEERGLRDLSQLLSIAVRARGIPACARSRAST